MKSRPVVSVIVPVYNAENYVEDCLGSIIGQTYEKLEILLIDDGSMDRSPGICDAFAKKDQRIKVIHQKNMGAAGARKRGILAASGEYLSFVDADDMIDSGMTEFFVEGMGECDLFTSGYRCETAPGEYATWRDSLEEGIYDTKETREYLIENMIVYNNCFEIGLQPYLCGKMYRTEIIKSVIEDIDLSIVYSEDRDLLFRCVLKSKGIRISHDSFYFYRYNPKSIMRTVNKNFMSDLNKLYISLEKAFAGHPQEECLLHQLQLFVLFRMYTIPSFMGFGPDAQMIGYVFPFSELEEGSRIVLYGAGKVGIRYYRQIHRQRLLRLVLWADKNWKDYENGSMPVSSPERIRDLEYDYVVIAVKERKTAKEIEAELVKMGVDQKQILWRPPAIL